MMDRSISHWHDVCFQNFGDLSDALSASEKSEYHEQMPMSFVIDQSGRFNVWAGNIGAQKRGSTSLDYRLRDASHIKDQVVGQLKFLAQRLEDALSIFLGRKVPFEEFPSSSSSSYSSESESSDSSASSIDEALSLSSTDFALCEDSKLPQTELLQLRHAISTFISNLYKISILIRRNPTPHDRLVKAAKIDISSFEPLDQQHAREKFPMAPDRLIERLGKANSQRRRYFKYRENHRQKLSLPTENTTPESKPRDAMKSGDISSYTPSKPQEFQPVSYQLSETDRAKTFSIKPSTAASTFIPPQPLKPFDLIQVDQESDTGTRTTHESALSINHDHLRVPVPPQISERNEFECPFCFHICRLRSTEKWRRDKEWKRHVFKDLQPYICTSGDCVESYTMFERRRDWIRHETRFHIREWCCNVPEHEVFSDKEKFKLHMNQLHPEFCNDLQMDTVIDMFQRPLESATVECPLCLNNGQGALTIGVFEKHVARHLESLALFALPRLDESETSSLGSVVTLNPSRTGSYTSKNRDPLEIQSFSPSNNNGPILDAIGAMEPLQLSRYQAAAYDRHPGSGLWFLKDMNYVRWKNNEDKVLLIQGMPRCGKTILCTVILEDLLSNSSSDCGIGFCFFETSYNSHNLAEQTLRLIIIQLYAQLRPPTEDIRQLIESGLWGLDLGILIPILKRVIDLHRSVYIVLDALDVVDATVTTIMSRLIQDFDKQEGRIQLIATSRFNLNIEEALLDTSNSNISSWRNCVAKCYLNLSQISLDIKKVAADRLENDPRFHIISSKDKEAYANFLTQSSNGLFEWAAFAIQNTRFSTLQKTFHDLQNYLPLEIENVWSEILHRICSYSKENTESAACMFRMLSVAVAPVSSETLIEFSSRRSLDHLQFWRECPAVLELLYNTNYSFDYGLFLHPFLSMFLRSDRIKQGSLRPFYISLEEAQQEVAEKCVAYLLQAEFPWSHSGFSGYSERYWHVHAANMPPYGSAKLDRTFQQRCIQLLDQQTYAFRYWTSSMGSIWSDFDYKEDYPPPLYYATLLDLYECARMLLDDHAADPAAYHPAAKYQCPFIAAVDNGKDRFVYLFTKYGVNADMIVDGGTPLFRAAKSGHSGVIQMLLDAGADVRARDFRGNTPLLEAIAHGQTETAKLLIDTGSNIEARSNNENNPLLLAVRNGHLECVKLLTNTGADIGARDHSGNTPLLLAIDKNRLECAKWLIDTGADIEARDNGGKAPLSLAILTGHTECAKLLLDAGADFEADNVFGSTPLLVAIDHNRIDCAKLLIMKGADFQAQDTWGRSAFHLCHPNSPMMELLLDAGANVDEEDGFGNTALYCAVDVSNHLKVESLLNAGANPNPRQRDAVWSPLKTAIMRYREHEKAEDEGDAYKYGHIISLLLRHGAELETEWITEEWSEGLRIVCGISG